MAVSSIAAFWAVAALLIVVPGADWAYVIGTVLGGRSVVLAVSGIALGYAGMTIIVAAGVGVLVARTPASLIALTVAGGCYLMWLGSRTLIRPAGHDVAAGHDAPAGHGAAARTDRATLVKGIGVSGLNPKGLLVFLALLPQFVSPRGSWPLAAQLGILGLVFTLSCAVFYLSMGSVIRRTLIARPGVARVITRVSGAAMVVIGALLLAERLLA
jgi:threonine/homoserine/homoserine lactone efflux protein